MEAYPIHKKSDCHKALNKFVLQYGAPDLLRIDGSQEQGGQHSKFQEKAWKYKIKIHTIEPERSNQNPSEGCICELRKKWYCTMFLTGCPRRLWNYGVPFIAKIMQMTTSFSRGLNGQTPLE